MSIYIFYVYIHDCIKYLYTYVHIDTEGGDEAEVELEARILAAEVGLYI